MPSPEKIMLSAHVSERDVNDLDAVQDLFRHLPRHPLTVASIRAGLEVLRRSPRKLKVYLQDYRFVDRIELRHRSISKG